MQMLFAKKDNDATLVEIRERSADVMLTALPEGNYYQNKEPVSSAYQPEYPPLTLPVIKSI